MKNTFPTIEANQISKSQMFYNTQFPLNWTPLLQRISNDSRPFKKKDSKLLCQEAFRGF